MARSGIDAQVFEVDAMECWLVQQPEEDEQILSENLSVLIKHAEDRNFMKLAGHANQASAGIRDARPEDDE
jgi:hypothetical protein